MDKLHNGFTISHSFSYGMYNMFSSLSKSCYLKFIMVPVSGYRCTLVTTKGSSHRGRQLV